jgi:lipoate---protein ligase
VSPLTVAPTPHALSLAGADLPGHSPPQLRVEVAREVAVVVSRSRDPRREVDLARCRADGVPVVVRPTGGGAVVLGPGAVAASLLARVPDLPGFPEPYFRRYCAAVVGAIAAVGVEGAVQRGVSDVCLGDRKVAGTSLRLWRARVLFQVALLVDLDVGLMDRYLPLPSRAPVYRAGRGHREFVVTLAEAGCTASPARVVAALEAAFAPEADPLR